MGLGDRLYRIRGALARRFLLKIKRATHRGPPRLIDPSARRVLVVAPHMDDEVIGCGGTLCLLRDREAEIHIVFATDSSTGPGDTAVAAQVTLTRRAEAAKVSEVMGFASTVELGLPDGRLHQHEDQLVNLLSEQINTIRPELIFCPFPADAHSDHMSCASALALAALRALREPSILAYEVWTPLWPNVAVDITDVASRKERAIRIYASQIDDRDYAAAALGFNRYRGLASSVGFAEAFYQATPQQFARLCSLLDEI